MTTSVFGSGTLPAGPLPAIQNSVCSSYVGQKLLFGSAICSGTNALTVNATGEGAVHMSTESFALFAVAAFLTVLAFVITVAVCACWTVKPTNIDLEKLHAKGPKDAISMPGVACHWLLGHTINEVPRADKMHHDRVTSSLTEGYKLTKGISTFRFLLPFYQLVPNSTVITVFSPENVDHILRSNFDNYVKGTYLTDCLRDLLGDGIFNTDGELWKIHRKTASYEFSVSKFRHFQTVVFGQNSLIFLSNLFEKAKSGQGFDLQDMFQRYTLDSIAKIGFGVDLECQIVKDMPFMKAFDSATEQISWRTDFPFIWKAMKLLNLGSERQLKKDLKVINTFSYDIIARRRQLPEEELKEKSDLLSRFMNLKKADGSQYDDVFLRDVVINFILAGRDTTANALSWMFYELMQRPETVEKIRREMDDVLGKERDRKNTPPVYDELSRLHYLQAVATETLRLHPSVPRDIKQCLKDDVLPDGFKVKAGNMVGYFPYAMGRQTWIWGEDALEFKPERHLSEDGRYCSPSQFKYPVFQAGPRICLGMQMAFIEIKLAAVMLLSNFDFSFAPGFDPSDIIYLRTITMPIMGRLPVTVRQIS